MLAVLLSALILSVSGTQAASGLEVVTGLGVSGRLVVEARAEPLPAYGLYMPELAAPLRARAEELARGEWSVATVREWRPAAGRMGRSLRLSRAEEELSLLLAAEGLAIGRAKADEPLLLHELVAATRNAQARGLGLWAELRRPPEVDAEWAAPLPYLFAHRVGGVALPLHSRDPAYDYRRELTEIAALGAGWVNLIVVALQDRVDSSRVELDSERTPSPGRVEVTVRIAREVGLEVLLMPIVLIRQPGSDDWRGTLAPRDLGRWWQSYDDWIGTMAWCAARGGATALAVGSELASRERDTDAWRRVIANARMRFPGYLTYSANWDHFDRLEFWDALDFAGLTGYFELSKAPSPSVTDLVAGWRQARRAVERLAAHAQRPVVFTEVGVPSQVGGASTPWDYTRSAPVDLDLQRRAFAAFERSFHDDGAQVDGYAGVFLYDWWGWGGATDGDYTAREKPAAEVWRRILRRGANADVERGSEDG